MDLAHRDGGLHIQELEVDEPDFFLEVLNEVEHGQLNAHRVVALEEVDDLLCYTLVLLQSNSFDHLNGEGILLLGIDASLVGYRFLGIWIVDFKIVHDTVGVIGRLGF